MRSVALLSLLAFAGCTGPGLLTDGSSVSFGTTGTGALREGTTLPFTGDGYFVPKRWRDRRRNYGTDELVRLMVRATRRVKRQYRNSLLGIADLSPRGGGPTPEHRSHRSGRDVDLLFYHLDENGKPVKATQMIKFDENGDSIAPTSQATSQPAKTTAAEEPADSPTSQPAEPPPVRKLDVPRTWALVRALVLDPEVPVQWIFVGRPAARMMLMHARRKKEPEHLIELAASAMQHPPAHMDHIHVRIFCSPSDLALGCVNTGSRRPPKKDTQKQIDSTPAKTLPEGVLARLGLGPIKLLGRF
jgi:penicillin-insensitive murein endopeptidase